MVAGLVHMGRVGANMARCMYTYPFWDSFSVWVTLAPPYRLLRKMHTRRDVYWVFFGKKMCTFTNRL